MKSAAEILDDIDAIIKEHGVALLATSTMEGLPYVYSIGLAATLGYELYIVGLAPDMAHTILNSMVNRLKDAPIDDHTPVDDIINKSLWLQRREPTGQEQLLFGVAFTRGRRPEYFRQVLWPDVQNRPPYDPDYDRTAPNGQQYSDQKL